MDDDKTKDNEQQTNNTPLDNPADNTPEDESKAAAPTEGEPANDETNEGTNEGEDVENADDELTEDEHSDYKPADRFDASAVHHLSGMYKNWFLDYASYVILERAVPSIEDGPTSWARP